jgi:hypothetical protein
LRYSKGETLNYHIQGDRLRAHRFPVAPGVREWKETLSRKAAELKAMNGIAAGRLTVANLACAYRTIANSIFTHNGEYGMADSYLSGGLAWGASYQMEAHYQMYRNTGDISQLRHLVKQFDRALQNLRQDLGTESPGWDDRTYARQKINADKFEFNASAGGYGINKSVRTNGLHASVNTYVPGKIYELSLNVKTDRNGKGRVYLKNETTGQLIKQTDGVTTNARVSSPEWKNYVFRYFMPSEAGQEISVNLEGDTGDSVYFDRVEFAQAAQYMVHDATALAPALKFVRDVKQNPALAATVYDGAKTYGAMADKFLPIAEKIVAKWDACYRPIAPDKGVYVCPDDESLTIPGQSLPHNQYGKMAQVMMHLYKITGKAEYRDRATAMLTLFKSKLETRTRASDGKQYYCWRYSDSILPDENRQGGIQDVSHAALEIDIVITAFEYGLVFDEADMRLFANTFLVSVWNGDPANPVIYDNIDPASTKPVPDDSWIRDWARLARWEPSIADILSAWLLNNNSLNVGGVTRMQLYAYLYPYM